MSDVCVVAGFCYFSDNKCNFVAKKLSCLMVITYCTLLVVDVGAAVARWLRLRWSLTRVAGGSWFDPC